MGEVRNRSQTLLIVEGNHEKNELFWLIFKCFPEINIDMDNVWIYGTNIYLLYEDIVKEYGADWADEEMDIDLPFVIVRNRHQMIFAIKMILQTSFWYLTMKDMIQIFRKEKFWKCKIVFPMQRIWENYISIIR